ncbi:MAG: restriction endonuclease subunit S [Pseudomonadota bacterium]
MSELPKGWVELPCGETFQQISTSNIKVKTKDTLSTGLYPVVDQGASKLAGYINDADKVIKIEKPICIFGDHTRIIKWIDFDFVPGADGTKILVSNSYLNERFFYHQLRSLEILDRGYSRHFKYLKESNFRIAPLNEQIRIANKLDSMLANVDAAQARLDKIPTILKRFRQSVLAAATSGELTKSWNGRNKKSSWRTERLIDVIESKPRNGKSPKGVDYETNIKNLTLSAITKGHFVDGKFKYVDLVVPEDSHLWLKKNDILIQRANSIDYVGVSAIYDGEDNAYVYPDLIMKCRANDKVLTKYLHYSLSSENVRKYFRNNATGTSGNMPKINQAIVSSAPIHLPATNEQKEIVRRVESLFTLAKKVEKQYSAAKARTNRLTQSTLAKAFRGELVPQDEHDEPASELLTRIKEQAELLKPRTV